MNIFDKKDIKPMLIAEEQKPFNNIDFIYELKLDGIRCIAYLDNSVTELRNKRNMIIAPGYPELHEIHKQAKVKCILDGELIVFANGRPDFSEMQRRSIMSNKIKIEFAAKRYPVSFVAYDILYYDDKQVTGLPLIERKKLLEEAIIENDRISISRYIEEKGIELYELTVQHNLEGIVAKRKESKYFFGKNTKDWIKIKYLKDDDFVVCGYIEKDSVIASLLLGQYNNENQLIYKGHVSIGVNREEFKTIINTKREIVSELKDLIKEDAVVWIEPVNVCIIRYMEKMPSGSLRQPVFKGLREDKTPLECKESSS